MDAWETPEQVAHREATAEKAKLHITEAQDLESSGKLKEAERLYVMAQEPDLAINMYKKNRMYDDVIRLVTSYRKNQLPETHTHIAQQLETEGNLQPSPEP